MKSRSNRTLVTAKSFRDAETAADSADQVLLTDSGAEPIRIEWAWERCELWEAAHGTTASNQVQRGERFRLSSGDDEVIVSMWSELHRTDLRWGEQAVCLYRHFRMILS